MAYRKRIDEEERRTEGEGRTVNGSFVTRAGFRMMMMIVFESRLREMENEVSKSAILYAQDVY